MAILCLAHTTDTTGVEVQILHGMMRYFELTVEGEATTANICMGLLGDVRAAQDPAVVEIDKIHFSHSHWCSRSTGANSGHNAGPDNGSATWHHARAVCS